MQQQSCDVTEEIIQKQTDKLSAALFTGHY